MSSRGGSPRRAVEGSRRSRSPSPRRRSRSPYSRRQDDGPRRREWRGPWRGYRGRVRDWNDHPRPVNNTRNDWYRGGEPNDQESAPLTEEERKRKELEDARRDDLTVLVVNLSLKATEKDIWTFFTTHAGKVRAIKLIKDSRSGKSKGIGYVEFQDAEAVLKSLNLTGQCILNQPVRVQASQAEKNRAAKAAKQQQEQLAAQGPTKIYIGGLVDELSGMSQNELRQLFSPFGTIIQIDVPKDPYTGRNRGYAFVQYLEAAQARDAMTAMHGFDIGGKQLKVGFAGQDAQGRSTTGPATIDGIDLDRIADDHDDRILHGGAAMRIALSQKLAQKVKDDLLLEGTNRPTGPPSTEVISLEGMFTKEEVEQDGLDMLEDVADDVKNECFKFGLVIDLFIDRENIDGKVHVRFADADQAMAAMKALNGRFFGGSQIKAKFTDPVEYTTMRQNAI